MAERDPYRPSTDYPDALAMVLDAVAQAEKHHIGFCAKVEKRYRAYRGIAEAKNVETDDWRSRLTVPYLLQTCETMLATMLISKPSWNVSPVVLPGQPVEMAVSRKQSGRHVEIALEKEMAEDGFALKQRPFMQQDFIAGFTVAKTLWRHKKGYRKFLEPTITLVEDADGNVLESHPGVEERERETTLRDGPGFVVRDVRDWLWPESAKSVKDAAWVIDRTWETFDCLKAKEKMGLYKDVDKVKDHQDMYAHLAVSEREQLLRGQQRTDGLIEVLEYWTDDRVITVASRSVVLSDEPNPFWHGEKPFIACASMPDAFQLPGISVVESLAQTQEYLWSLQNHRLDNLRLLNNVITLIRDDAEDPDSFDFYPGAQWFVTDPAQVSTLPIDGTVAQISLEAETLLKGDLQNVMGGMPYSGAASSGTIDQTTATGMSIITSIAERMIKARQQQYTWAYAKIGEHFLSNMSQFVRQERAYLVPGRGGAMDAMLVGPTDFQGDWACDIDVMEESMMRQERRAEAQSLLQMAGQLAQIVPLNMQKFVERVLDSYGIQDTESYFKDEPAPGQQQQAGIGAEAPTAQTVQQGMQPDPAAASDSGGQTNPALAGAHGLSQSPDMLMAGRLKAVQGAGG